MSIEVEPYKVEFVDAKLGLHSCRVVGPTQTHVEVAIGRGRASFLCGALNAAYRAGFAAAHPHSVRAEAEILSVSAERLQPQTDGHSDDRHAQTPLTP